MCNIIYKTKEERTNHSMVYIKFEFYILLIILLIAYYSVPLKHRWYILLGASLGFYSIFSDHIVLLLFVSIISFVFGQVLYKKKSKLLLFVSILSVLLPLLITKHPTGLFGFMKWNNIIAPLGISFFTLQIIAYLVDIYREEILPQNNYLKYLLYVSFFPQIIQGPIPRYKQMGEQLIEGHRFDENNFVKGIHLIIWGFFLKLMIADKAAIVVNTVFDNYVNYSGFYILVAGILYSIQLYTDFQACVCITKGVAQLFSINIIDNFMHPYMSKSIKEFWQRWHISFSSWLRDYIYIPLGGNRKGKLYKYRNLIITFVISGMWHGNGIKYVLWGVLHAVYQIFGEILNPIKIKLYEMIKISKDSIMSKIFEIIITFYCVMIGWIIFRANGAVVGIKMIFSMFNTFNPWIFFDDSLLELGLCVKEWFVLISSILIGVIVSCLQQKTIIRDWILQQHLLLRWIIYIVAIIVIWVFGTYGFGFESKDFIYGGF